MKSNRLKQKSNSSVVNDGNKSYFVFKHGIKIYPIYDETMKKFKIQVENNGKKTTFPKLITQKEINEALAKTVNYYYDKLK